jgi:hypothetical protein
VGILTFLKSQKVSLLENAIPILEVAKAHPCYEMPFIPMFRGLCSLLCRFAWDHLFETKEGGGKGFVALICSE